MLSILKVSRWKINTEDVSFMEPCSQPGQGYFIFIIYENQDYFISYLLERMVYEGKLGVYPRKTKANGTKQ